MASGSSLLLARTETLKRVWASLFYSGTRSGCQTSKTRVKAVVVNGQGKGECAYQRLPLIGCHVDDALRFPYNTGLPIDALYQYAVVQVRNNYWSTRIGATNQLRGGS